MEKPAITLETSQASAALAQLRESATGVTRAFAAMNAADPKQFMAQVAQLATSVAGLNQDMIRNFAALEKAVADSGRGVADSARKAGRDMSKSLAAGLKEGEAEVAMTMRQQTQQLQAWYEASTAKGWNFKDSALNKLKAQGVNLGPDVKADTFSDNLRAKSASKMTEEDTRALLGMPDRGEMKTLAASLKSQMNEAMQTSTLRAKSASKMTEEDTRALLGMPGRAEMDTFSARLKAQMTESAALELANTKLATAKAKTADAARNTGSAFKELSSHSHDLHSAARGLASGFNAMWLTWGNLVPLLAGAAVSNAFVQSVKAGAEFQGTITAIGELAGASAVELGQLSQAALDIGSSSKYGPLEVATGLKTLALAGLDAKQQLAALKPVMNFATAGEMDLTKAAESLTAISTAFGYQADGFGAVADVIAKAAAVSMSSISDMTEAFRQASTVAQQFGVSVTDASTVLALLSQVGIKGSAAGTAMRNMYNELLGSSRQAREVLTKYLGIDIIDNSTKSVKDLTTIFRDLGGALGKYDFESQLRLLQEMGNERGGKAIAATLTAAVTQLKESGGDISTVLSELQQKLADAPGFVAQAAVGMALTAENQIKSVGNALQSALILAFKEAEPVVLAVANDLRGLFNSPEFLDGLKTIVEGIAQLVGFLVKNIDLIAAVAAGFALGTSALLAMNAAVAAAQVVLPALGAAIGALTGGATVTLGALAAAFWPVTLALGVVAGAWYVFGKEAEDANIKAMKASKASTQAVQAGLAEEARRLTEQIRLRKEGSKNEDVLAAARTNLALQEMQQTHKLELAHAQLAHAKLLSAKAGLDPNVGVDVARAAQLEKQLEASGKRIANLGYDQIRAQAAFSDQAARTKALAQEDAKLAADKARDSRQTPTGAKVFTPGGSGGAGLGSLPRDSALQELQKQLTDQESVVKNAYDNKKRLLDLDHRYHLISEGAYQAEVLRTTAEFEAERSRLRVNAMVDYEISYANRVDGMDKNPKLKPEAKKQALDNLGVERKTFLGKTSADEAKDAEDVSARRAEALRTMAGEVNKAGMAVDVYVQKMKRELDAEEALLIVKREQQDSTPAMRARYEAETSFTSKHANELDRLLKIYEDLDKAARDLKSNLPSGGGTPEMQSAVSGAEGAAAAAKTNLDKARAAVSTGADRAGRLATDALKDQNNALAGAKKGFADYRDSAINSFEAIRNTSKRALNDMTDSIMVFAKTGELNFDRMVNNMIDDILRMSIQQAIMAPSGGGGTFGMFETMASFLFSANGNAFGPGGLIPFAKGGIFDSPTAFGFGGGNLGVMGEAGPEAVMPLSRGADGRLGISGGGGANVSLTVNVIEDSSRAGTTQTRRGEGGGSVLDVFVDKVKASLAADITQGRGQVPAAMSSTYGLNRTAGSY